MVISSPIWNAYVSQSSSALNWELFSNVLAIPKLCNTSKSSSVLPSITFLFHQEFNCLSLDATFVPFPCLLFYRMIIMEIFKTIRSLYRTFHFQVWAMSLIIQGRRSRQVPCREAIIQLHVPGMTSFSEGREIEEREGDASECEINTRLF